jgi:hypothetical protein
MGDIEEIKEVPPSGAKEAASTASTIAKPEPSSAAPKATEPVTDKVRKMWPDTSLGLGSFAQHAPHTSYFNRENTRSMRDKNVQFPGK